MRYFGVRLKQKQTERLYRIYVTDGLYALSNRGQRLSRRWIDIVEPDNAVIEETRTPEEIINAIKSKLERIAAE